MTQPASSADYQPPVPPQPDHAPGPQPVPVTGIDATHVHLGDGAARDSISRGEVRTLRRFQQRLDAKTDRLTMVGEATRTLEQHANEQAKQVMELLEQARGVKGGDKLVAALAKLADAAQVQATKASEIYKRAVRSGEACKALHGNAETRYGGIYKAVVDSPETSPAEMNYYREMAHA
jgi:DNA repair ATPase RecN